MKKVVNTCNRSAVLALKIVGSIIIVKILKFHIILLNLIVDNNTLKNKIIGI